MFKAAFYEKEITPPLGCHLPGYFNVRKGSDVKDRLYAKAMVVSDGENKVAVISIDGCSVEFEIREIICKRISEFTDIKPENVMVNYVHTHTGIPFSKFNKDEDAMKNQEEYFTVFSKLIADCAILADMRLSDSILKYANGNVEGISFCRNYIMKNSTPRTNPGVLNPDIIAPTVEIDTSLPVVFVYDNKGKPKGALFAFDCHLDCVDGTEYSGDFPAEVSKIFKKAYGEDFVSVFLMGTAGNVNHFNVKKPIEDPYHYRYMGKLIANELLRIEKNAQVISQTNVKANYEMIKLNRCEIEDSKIKAAEHTVATIKEIPGIKIAADNTDPDQYNLAMAKRLLTFINTNPDSFDMPLQVLIIGDFKLYGFPGEIFSHFGKMIREGTDTKKHMVASMANKSCGYVPTKDMFYSTIYESRVGSNILEREAGYIMANKLLEMGSI